MRRMYPDIQKNVFIYPDIGLRTSGSSEPQILIFGWVLACIGSGVNRVTVDFHLLIQVAWVQKAQFLYRLDGLAP